MSKEQKDFDLNMIITTSGENSVIDNQSDSSLQEMELNKEIKSRKDKINQIKQDIQDINIKISLLLDKNSSEGNTLRDRRELLHLENYKLFEEVDELNVKINAILRKKKVPR